VGVQDGDKHKGTLGRGRVESSGLHAESAVAQESRKEKTRTGNEMIYIDLETTPNSGNLRPRRGLCKRAGESQKV